MKKILFITILMSIISSLSANTNEHIKLMQLYLDKNQPDKVEDLYDEHEDQLNKSWIALERLALSFERREKFKEAIEIYRKIIISFNKSAHEKVVKTPIKNLKSETYNSTKLSLYYYKLAFLYTQLYSKTNLYTVESDKNRFKKNAEGFIALCRKIKVEESDIKLLEDLLSEKITYDENLIYKESWYATLDIVSWQDEILLVDKNNNQKIKLLSTAIGSCLGGGKKWENIKYEFSLESCLALTTATISSNNNSIAYQQSSVSVKGLLFGPGLYFKTFSENILLGIHLPVKIRQGDWTNPDENQYRLEKTKSIEAGYFLQSKIKIKNLSLRTRLGKVFPNPGSIWSVGVLYDF